MATLMELTERMRLRIGEVGVRTGSWDDRTEIKLALNISQVELAKALYSRGESWSEKIGIRIPVENDAEYYLCPDNFMIEEKVGHFHPNWGYRRLFKGSIQDARLNRLDSTYSYSGSYGVYEVRGKTAVWIAIGTADTGSDAGVLRDSNGNFSEVRVGDIAHNINDGSEADVVDFSSGFVMLDNWRGGASQRFYTGESYRIASRERYAHQLWCFPPVTDVDRQISLQNQTAEGTAIIRFSVSEDVLVHSMDVKISAVPSDWEDDNVFFFVFRDGNDLVPRSRFGMQRVRVGYNSVPSFVPFRLQEGRNYSFQGFGGATATELRLYKESNNFIDMNFTPLPAPLLYDNSICEFSDEWLEPLLDHTKILLMDKTHPNGEMFNALAQRFEWSKDSAKEYKNMAAADNIEVVRGYGEDSASVNLGVQPGYTLNHGIVEL